MMGDDKDEQPKTADTTEAPARPARVTQSPVGKQYRGQSHGALLSAEDVQAQIDAQKKYDKEGAVSIDTYFARCNVIDPVAKAGMRAFTKIRNATIEDWDSIFQAY